jgi:hypothetical protein
MMPGLAIAEWLARSAASRDAQPTSRRNARGSRRFGWRAARRILDAESDQQVP